MSNMGHTQRHGVRSSGLRLFLDFAFDGLSRAGAFDFSCASCHGVDDKRIRTQPLPNFTKPAQAIRAVQGWPGYRMTGGVMHSLQWRLNDCYRQQRFPEPGYASETLSALLSYVTVNANGQVYRGPGIKR